MSGKRTGKSKSPSTPRDEEVSLEEKSWYHGMRPRKECEALLTELGDWLVRATDNDKEGHLSVVLSVHTEKGHRHLTLSKDANGRFTLQLISKKTAPSFATVAGLIEHYHKKGGIGGIKMGHAKNRPNWLIKHEQVNFDENKDRLGAGNYCVVYKGTYKVDGRTVPVAVKVCLPLAEQRTPEQITNERLSMLREAELLSSYSHLNVIRLYGVAADSPPVKIVLEYCPAGSLDRHLQEHKSRIEPAERVLYMLDAADGMRYLHKQGCIHRDIASRNCLIGLTGWIKIADFGLSKMIGRKLDKEEEETEAQLGLPLRWMAPECLQKKREFSKKSDVWSMGVMIWETFNEGAKPWPDWEAKKIATYIRKGKMPEFPSGTPAHLKDYVEKHVWSVNLDTRTDMEGVWKNLDETRASVGNPKNSVIEREQRSRSPHQMSMWHSL
ncbi:unnamed protein product, partial [Mesorhabditis spiculigera]